MCNPGSHPPEVANSCLSIVIEVFNALASPTFPVEIPHPAFPGIDQEIAYRSGINPDVGAFQFRVTVPLSTDATRLDGAFIVTAGKKQGIVGPQ
jgi:hypothetical protein